MKKIIFIIWVLFLAGCAQGDLFQQQPEIVKQIFPNLPDIVPDEIKPWVGRFYVINDLVKKGIINKPTCYITYDGRTVESEKELADDRSTRNQAIAIYTVGGGALGALIGQIAGKDTKSTLLGAGFGSFLGCLLGAKKGSDAVADKKRIDKERKALKTEINRIKKVNSEAKKYNKQLSGDIRYYTSLKKNNTLKNEALKNAKQKYIEAKGLCNITKMKLKELEEIKSKTHNDNQGQIAKLDVEINELRKEIATLETQTEQLASVGQRRRV